VDVVDQINKFKDFLEKYHYAELLENVRQGKKHLIVDFQNLSEFDFELASLILDQPEEVLKALELAVAEFDLPEEVSGFKVRVIRLPESQKIKIRNIRSSNLGKFLMIEGLVRQKSDVRPQVTSAKFECPSCGNVLNVLQLDKQFKEPTRCGCGRKGKFRMLSKELIDAQGLKLEESTEDLDGGEQPKRINIFLKNDLVSPLSDRKTNPGSKIKICGMLKEVPITTRTGGQSTTFDLMIEANSVESVEEDFGEIVISPEEEAAIKSLSQEPKIYIKLVESMVPSIYGHDKVKEAIMLQLMGGVAKTRPDGVRTKGDMHVMLIGDPGCGKTQVLKRFSIIAPKSRFVSGKGASGAGLTASVVKDEFLQGWSLEAGALVLANKGFCLTANTEIQTPKGFRNIKDLCKDFKNGKNSEILSLDYDSLKFKKTKIKNTSKRKAKISKVTLENGDFLKITQEHPVLVWNNGYFWKNAGEIKTGDYVITKRRFPSNKTFPYIVDLLDEVFVNFDLNLLPKFSHSNLNIPKHRLNSKNRLKVKDIKNICNHLNFDFDKIKSKIKIKDLPKKINSDLGLFLGLILTDGNLSKEKCCIRFYNKSQELINTYKILVKKLFKINTSSYVDERNGVTQLHFSSKTVFNLVEKFGIKKGNKSKSELNLSLIRIMPESFVLKFLSGVINGDGTVCARKSGGLIEVVGGNKNTLDQIRKIIRKIGIISKVVEFTTYGGDKTVPKGIYENFKLRITGLSNFKSIDVNSLVGNKKEKLLQILKSKPASFKIPKIDEIFTSLSSKIPHREKKILYNNSIRLSNLRKMNLSMHVLENVLDKLANKPPTKFTDEFKLLEKLVNQDMIFLKVSNIEKLGEDWVYNLEINMKKEPNFFANFIPVHNCCIDELDKMGKEDRSAMHEALEQQSVTISKANIQATLRCETTVLAAANPKFGRFDPYELLAKQIDLPSTLINRFDLIFPIRDLPDEASDNAKAQFILDLHQNVESKKRDASEIIETELLKKYVSYARKYCVPKLSTEAVNEIKQYYVNLRNSGGDEGGVKAIPISARQLEGLIRLSEAIAKTRLSENVTKEDAKKAVELMHYCLSQIGLDPETGKIDIDRISSGITASTRGKITSVKECIMELEGKIGKVVPLDDLMKLCEDKGLRKDDVDDVIEKLKRSGDLFSPRRNFISRI
jgi:replicative DNA helicase Mcm